MVERLVERYKVDVDQSTALYTGSLDVYGPSHLAYSCSENRTPNSLCQVFYYFFFEFHLKLDSFINIGF